MCHNSFVYILFFYGQMESKIGKANCHVIIFGWYEQFFMAISSYGFFLLIEDAINCISVEFTNNDSIFIS
jgi:hypothetical protein